MPANVTIAVSKKCLIIGALVTFVVSIFVIGLAVTPFDHTQGRPFDKAGKAVLLTTENRRIKAYLDNAGRWQQALEETREQLLSLLSSSLPEDVLTPEPTSELWEPSPAGGAPLSVYEQNRIATAAVDRLVAVSIQVDRAEVPQALQGTHAVVCQAVRDHLQLANLVLDYVGAPDDAKIASFQAQLDVCHWDTSRLRELLDVEDR